MGILGRILGSDAIIAKGMELIDDAFESDAEARESKAKTKIDLMNAYAPFKVAQRYLALMFGGTYLLTYFFIMTASVFDLIDREALTEVRAIMAEFSIDWIMLTVVGFYFGGGLAESIRRPKEAPK